MSTLKRSVGLCLIGLVSAARLASGAADPLLAEAIKQSDVSAVHALVKKGVDVNGPLPDGRTALHWAVERDDLATVAALIDAGAQVDAADDYGVPPLWLAATNRNAEIVARLLDKGANPSATLPSGETVLMRAAHTGNADLVRLLVQRSADVNAKETVLGQTALMWAAAEGHVEAARVLIQSGAEISIRSTSGYTALLLASRNADVAMTSLLLEAGADVNESAADGTTALVVATIRGNTALAKFLLDRGADANAGPGFSPLHWVAGRWSGAGADARMDEYSDWRIFNGLDGSAAVELAQLLIAHGADPNRPATRSPSYQPGPRAGGRPRPESRPAVSSERREARPMAASERPGPSFPGATPFWIAAKFARLDLMRVLVASGADPNRPTEKMVTPLMAAAGMGSGVGNNPVPQEQALEAVKLCLELAGNNIDVNATSLDGETVMHGAAYRGPQGAAAIIKFLVDAGVDMNVKNRWGWTPLTIVEGLYTTAYNSRDPEAAALLQSLGADPTPENFDRNVGSTFQLVINP